MPDFTITISAAQQARTRDALCAYVGKTAPVDQTLANARAGLAQLVKNTVRAYEANAAQAAAAAAVADVDVT